jgi:hypothetical protein
MALKKEGFSVKRKAIPVIVMSLFLLSGSGGSALAQDMLILKSGKEIKANIIEESTDIVKYREYENPEGPLYSIGKDKVASIQYKNRSKGVQENQAKGKENIISAGKETPVQSNAFQPLTYKKRQVKADGKVLSVRQVKNLMEDYPDALRKYETGKTLGRASNGCALGVMVVSFVATQMMNKKEVQSEKMKIGYPAFAMDGALIIAGIVMASIGRHNIRSAVTIYNSAAGKPVTYKLNLGLQEHGIGLALRY